MITIGVHGFGFDPDSPDDNPNENLYPLWAKMVDGPFYGLAWYSCPVGWKHVARAWRSGYPIRYYYAWQLAIEQAARLRGVIRWRAEETGREVNLLGHSLGSRVILAALASRRELPVNRVLLLSAADSRAHAKSVAPYIRNCEILNVVVKDDGVLSVPGRWLTPKRGREPVIGYSGLPDSPGFWHDVELPEAKDHWDAYEDRRNWPRWKAFLHGGQI